MALFQFRWLRRLVRRHTHPMQEDRATIWKQRLSIGYMLLAWNAFGFVAYMIFSGKSDWARYYGIKSDVEMNLSPAQQWARTLGIKDATVYRVQGLNVTKYEIHNEDGKEQEATEINNKL